MQYTSDLGTLQTRLEEAEGYRLACKLKAIQSHELTEVNSEFFYRSLGQQRWRRLGYLLLVFTFQPR